MENDKRDKNRKRSGENAPQIGAVRVFSKPGPDAEDRLRRLMSLLIKYATQSGQAANGEDAPPNDHSPEDHAGEDGSCHPDRR